MLSQLKEEKKKEIDLQGVKDNAKKVISQTMHRDVDNTKPANAPSYAEDTSRRAETKREKSVNDYVLMNYDRSSNGTDSDFGIDTKKPFKSRYVDDNGAWTHEAVDDGYVEFGDYIKDRREGVDNGISFNGKQFNPKFSNVSDEPYETEISYVEPRKGNDSLAYYYDEDKEYLDGFEIDQVSDDYAGVGDVLWNVADETLKFGGKVVGSAIQSVLKFAKQSPYYDMVVEDVKDIWRWGADNLLRGKFECYSSAWLLEHALQDNPSAQYRGNNSRIAWLVNNNKAYLSKLDEAIENSNGKTLDDTISVTFNSGTPDEDDLYLSIYHVDINVKGYKREDGKWIIHSSFKDKYDFTELMWFDLEEYKNMSVMKALGMTANDVATISSWGDVIKPYWLYVDFYTTR